MPKTKEIPSNNWSGLKKNWKTDALAAISVSLIALPLSLGIALAAGAPAMSGILSAIVGGIGNPFGAFLGGYVIAFSEILLTYAYRKFFMYVLPETMEPGGLVQLLSTDYKFAVSFSILVIVLLYRPSGIFKGKIL